MYRIEVVCHVNLFSSMHRNKIKMDLLHHYEIFKIFALISICLQYPDASINTRKIPKK